MTFAKIALTIVLSQYVRSRINDKDQKTQCLWWLENTEIVFHQESAGSPRIPNETEFAAMDKAMGAWAVQLSACSSLKLTDGPRTSSRKVGYFAKETNENITVFRETKCDDVVPKDATCGEECGNPYDCWQHQAGAIAITTTSFSPSTGRILDSDIEFNVPSFLFTTVDSPPCLAGNYRDDCVATDVQNTATHEFGHVLGLAHIANVGSTMNASAVPGETSKRTLDTGSATFVCDVYPKGQAAKTCFIVPVSDTLGPVAKGCSSMPGEALAALVLVLWRRRRTR